MGLVGMRWDGIGWDEMGWDWLGWDGISPSRERQKIGEKNKSAPRENWEGASSFRVAPIHFSRQSFSTRAKD